MVIREALEYGKIHLSNNLYTNPLDESRKILSFLLKQDLSFVYINPDHPLDEGVRKRFLEIINKRSIGLPLEYIINEKNFYGRDFYVDERVLIPRWDTENLVSQVIELSLGREEIEILEIGVGSGAVSLTLGIELKEAKITGVDISYKALEVCKINKEKLGVKNVTFIYSDLFSNVEGKYDIIVSNPPYIKTRNMKELQKEVTYEPCLALDGGADGLDFYKSIAEKSKEYLYSEGILIFEIGHNQRKDLVDILEKNNYTNINWKKDLQGLDRVIWGHKEMKKNV